MTLMCDLMTVNDIKNAINSVTDPGGFVFGTFTDRPDTKGVCRIRSAWFLYEIDERNVKTISGPFDDNDILYACAKMLHVSGYFKPFSKEARDKYLHIHYRSLKEAEEVL